MKTIIRKLVIMVGLTSFTFANPGETVIYMIGDSTMADKPVSVYPETGWGMVMHTFFDATVKIDNRAKNGRSTRTFLEENRWQPIVDKLEPGDYVFIQFGHNDGATGAKYKERYTSPEDYRKNLVRFITETRSKGAAPVLITPVTRRYFDDEGQIRETHVNYTGMAYKVAEEYDAILIDLDKMSRDLVQRFGPEYSKLMYLHLEPGEHPNYPDGVDDDTHFSTFGARKMAQLVIQEVRKQIPDLEKRIVKPDR